MIKCAIYARVSTDQQGDSIENQISQALEYISRLGDQYDTQDVLIYKDEAVSGYYTSVFERTAMKQAIADAKDGKFQVIVFKEISRVGRDKQENPAIIGMFEQFKIRVIAMNDNYDSNNKDSITFDILSVLAEQESKKISSRVSSAKKQKARRGQWNGTPPIGYRVDAETKKLVIDEERKQIPTIIFDMYVNQGAGTFKIAHYLNECGLLTANGNLWSRKTITDVITNEAYIGRVVYGMSRNTLERTYDMSGKMYKRQARVLLDKSEWTVVENAHEPLIDPEIFYKAQSILMQRSHNRVPRRAYHPLTGILYCGKCGEGMVCQKRTWNGNEYRYYICKTYHKYGRGKCNQTNIKADEFEQMIVDQVRAWIKERRIGEAIANQSRDMENIKREIAVRQKQLDKIQKDQKDLFQHRELFTEEAFKEQMLELKRQAEFLEREFDVLTQQEKLLLEKQNESETYEHIVEEFKQLDVNEKGKLRALLHDIIHSITVNEYDLEIEYRF
jgi:site-specific DNA recombinase